ncbi:cytochrome c554 and C-prime [Leptospira koniambonensis]|uniref:Cytochrome c554 and C-prime n=1 Tax=Leptospira koniambonensis TaxID=2484950 RepID=A0A4R9J6N2_9LEPT|nr:multiheme c-type cytochrome [Leptospira koniambonensis]TGL34377.1 cytochrome c554 and C-prime [Leptospira koniambonensis]
MKFKTLSIGIILAFALILISIVNLSSENFQNRLEIVLGLEKGLHAVNFDPNKDSIRDRYTGKILGSASDCKVCHKQVYENWSASRHKVAHTNSLYQHSFTIEPMQWCENCHAPLRNISSQTIYKREEGISCNVCHVRKGEIITKELPKSDQLYHKYNVVEEFGTEKLCESCHQFNFPTWASLSDQAKPIQYSDLVMQGTKDEWSGSGFAKESDCIDCHLAPGSKRSHNFRGGHGIENLKESLYVELKYVSSKTILVQVHSIGIGHAYPTGDLFRALRLKVFSDTGKLHEEFLLRKLYKITSKEEREKQSAPKKLIYDSRIPAPEEGQNSAVKEFYLELQERPVSLKIELWIDYLNDIEKILTPMNKKETMKIILKKTVIVQEREKFTGKESG